MAFLYSNKKVIKLHYLFNLLKNIQVYIFNKIGYVISYYYTQINNKNETKSLETLREVSFNFEEFYKKHKNIDPNWLQWFIRFTEGDGSIYSDKSGGIQFIITQNENKILNEIKEKLGFGTVSYDKLAKTYRFKVLDLPSILKLTYLFNGNLYLIHRINQLEKWIEILNSKSYSIKHIITKVNISLQDSWLSGFTDSEGCFNVHIFKMIDML